MSTHPSTDSNQKKEDFQTPQFQMRPLGGPGPGPGAGPGRMMHFGEKAKLDHPRGILWHWIISYIAPFSVSYILFFMLLLFGTVVTAISPLLTAKMIDRGILARDYIFLRNISIIYICLMFVYAITNYLASYGMGKIGQVIVLNVRNDLIAKIQSMSLLYFDKKASGDIISITTNDVDQLNNLVSGQLVQIISSFTSIGLGIVSMYILNPLLATYSLVTIPIFLIFSKAFTRAATGVFKETRKTISQVTSSIQENIAGAKIVQAYGQEKRASNEFQQANKANFNASVKARRVFATFFPLIGLITQFLTASIILLGGFAILGNVSLLGISVSVGVLTSFIMILAEFFRPFMTLTQIQQMIESALAASDRIYDLLQEEVDLEDPQNPVELPQIRGQIQFEKISFGYKFTNNEGKNHKSKSPAKNSNNQKPKKLFFRKKGEDITIPQQPAVNISMSPDEILNLVKTLENIIQKQLGKPAGMSSGGLGNENNSMGRPKGGSNTKEMLRILAMQNIEPVLFNQFPKIVQEGITEEKRRLEHERTYGYVLENLDLEISPGTTLAIVGETGAGKTTLIKLLARFYDVNQGSIKLDGIDIRKIRKIDLRKHIGLVPQDSFIFKGTIRENLLYGIEHPTPADEIRMIEISKFLGLHNFIDVLEFKYETQLIENGSNISIGQRQLIAFARALLINPKILILDEATSSVDPYTETLIQDALDRARKGRTTIIIAHRLSTIKNADKIIVLGKEKRGIIEQGTHESLITLNGRYQKLLEMQNY